MRPGADHLSIPFRFLNLDRDTPMHMAPDLRVRVHDDDLAHLVLDGIVFLPLTRFRRNHKGTGSEHYPPRMLLSLRNYC